MKPQNKPNKKLWILWVVLLAVVCIGTVELVACRFFAPTLFYNITTPIVTTVTAVADTVVDTVQTTARATGEAIDTLSHRLQAAITEAKEKREAEQQQKELENIQSEPSDTDIPPEESEEPENQCVTAPLLNIPPSICDPSITELKTVGEQEVLTGGPIRVVCYLQGDERWGNLKYGSDKISSHGCGPTALAMVVSSMTDTTIQPQDMAQWAVNHGHWARQSGSYHSIVIGAATAFGLQAEGYPLRDTDALREELLSGNLFVALMGPGHFTRSGHFIVLRGVTLSGDILVADPGSLERSLTAWDAQLILDELSKSTASGSPLWLISHTENTNFA